jgi:hypothetical protein
MRFRRGFPRTGTLEHLKVRREQLTLALDPRGTSSSLISSVLKKIGLKGREVGCLPKDAKKLLVEGQMGRVARIYKTP